MYTSKSFILQVALWSSIPYVVPPAAVGTANGIVSCMLDLTVGSTTLVIGQTMSNSERYNRILKTSLKRAVVSRRYQNYYERRRDREVLRVGLMIHGSLVKL